LRVKLLTRLSPFSDPFGSDMERIPGCRGFKFEKLCNTYNFLMRFPSGSLIIKNHEIALNKLPISSFLLQAIKKEVEYSAGKTKNKGAKNRNA